MRHTQLAVVPTTSTALVRRLAGSSRPWARFCCRRSGTAASFGSIRSTVASSRALPPRAAKAYEDDAYVFTETLRAEIQAKDDVNVYKLSGRALKHGVRERWGHANPGYMQIDDGIICDDDGFVTHGGANQLMRSGSTASRRSSR